MSTSQTRAFRYVPALDGVRALSLAAILVFHSHFPWARGGFLGVTVFFTLSGFLITSLLLTERERSGAIGLRAFWVRRARRLAPAVLVLFALVAFLLYAGMLVGSKSVAGDALATAGWSANWRFVLSGQSYGAMFSTPTPFQHMWSLAVEEQFYLLFPGFLLLLLGRAERLRRWRAALVVLGCIGLSTWLCATLAHPGAVERSYYGTDTRMAEPFVGVLLALLLIRGGAVRELPRVARWALDVAALGALGALGMLMHGYSQYAHSLYQGGLLLVAVLSAVLLAGITQPGSLLGRVLGTPPLVFVGKVSYGGYVFHWPVYLWLTAERTGLSAWPLFAVRASVTLALAVISYAVIEEPIRLSKKLEVSTAIPAWAATTTLALAAVVLASGAVAPTAVHASTHRSHTTSAAATRRPGVASPSAAASATASAAARARARQHAAAARTATARSTTSPTTTPTQGGQPAPVPSNDPNNKPVKPVTAPRGPRVVVVGDSLAYDMGKGLASYAGDAKTFSALNLSMRGCPIARGGWRRWPDGYELQVQDGCSWWADPTSTRMKEFQSFDPQVVVIQDGLNELVERKDVDWQGNGQVGTSYKRAGDPTFDSWLLREYQLALQAFNPAGTRKVLFLNAVCADWNNMNHFQGFQPELNSRITSLNLDYGNLSGTNFTLVDFKAHLCPNGQYTSTVDGVPDGRYDGYHLTDDAGYALADHWLAPLCLDAFKQ